MRRQDERQEHYDYFIKCFNKATANVTQEYMDYSIQDSPSIYRERVYCYELYHQLRLSMTDSFFGYSLNGEVDKSGNLAMVGEDITGTKPDLLVHRPGTMDYNLIVIEVKPVTANDTSIHNDLKKLIAYTDRAKYFCAIYLVYGNSQRDFDRLACTLKRLIRERPYQIANGKINLYWHKRAMEQAELMTLIDEA